MANPTQARSGFGTLLKIGDGAGPEVFTTIAELVDADAPDQVLNFADATNMESPSGAMEDVATLLQTSEVSFTLNFLPGDATQALLTTAQVAKRKANFQIILPGAARRFEGAAYVSKVGRAMKHDDAMRMTVSLKPQGLWNLVPNP